MTSASLKSEVHLGVAVNQMLAFLMHFAIHVFLHQGIAEFLQLLGHQHLPGQAATLNPQQKLEQLQSMGKYSRWMPLASESDSNSAGVGLFGIAATKVVHLRKEF